MCFLRGRLDPSWTSRSHLWKSTVAGRISSIIDDEVPDDWEYGMEPYCRTVRPPHVSGFLAAF